MNVTRCVSLAVIVMAIANPALAQSRGVPVMVGEEPSLDACLGWGQVVGLDPNGDGFLSARTGPGGKYQERDRLHNGAGVHMCDQRGKWVGIVYSHDRDQDCNVSTPWAVRQPYTGPCRWGWVPERYIKLVAG
jgi:hypothetical protein